MGIGSLRLQYGFGGRIDPYDNKFIVNGILIEYIMPELHCRIIISQTNP